MSKEGVRIRQTGGIDQIGGTLIATYNGTQTANQTYKPGLSGQTKWMRDYVTPDFQKRKSEGRLVNNGMLSIVDTRSDVGSGSTHSHIIGAGPGREIYQFSNLFCQRVDGRVVEVALFSDSEVESMKTEVGTRASAKIEANTSDGLVTIAEITKTLRTLKRPFENIEGLVKDIGKSNTYRKYHKAHMTSSLLSFMEKEWLRLRYGFRPMMYDIQSTADAFWNLTSGPKINKRITVRDQKSWSRSSNTSTTHVDSTFEGPVSSVFKDEIVIRSGVLYERGFENMQTMRNRELGIRLSDLPALAWEIVPYSFIGDWVLNVGEAIDAWTPRYGVTNLVSWTTIRRRKSASKNMGPFTLRSHVSAAGWTLDSAPATGLSNADVLIVERFPFINSGIVYKVDSLPKVGNDVKKVLDIYTLFSQNLRK